MNSKFSVDDIKKHLVDLGYTNIPEDKLETFVGDLRRLVKYEERKKRLDGKLASLENSKPSQNIESSGRLRTQTRRTKSARDETVPPTSKYSHTTENSSSTFQTATTTECSSAGTTTSTFSRSRSVDESSLYVDVLIPRPKQEKMSGVSLIDPRQTSGLIRCRSTTAIRQNSGRRDVNTDPVRLHQKYAAAWRSLKLPGETSHNKLRWAVRGWMMGEDPR